MCGRADVSEESTGEAIGDNVAQLQRETQLLGDASTMGRPPRTAAAVECSQLEPRQYVCLANAEPEVT